MISLLVLIFFHTLLLNDWIPFMMEDWILIMKDTVGDPLQALNLFSNLRRCLILGFDS